MPATPARISFVVQPYRSALASDAGVLARYGPSARDTGATPVPTYFDDMGDTQAMVNERFALLKADRRKFTVEVAGIVSFTGALDFSQTVPSVQIVDDEKKANFAGAIVGIASVDYDAAKTTIVVWG